MSEALLSDADLGLSYPPDAGGAADPYAGREITVRPVRPPVPEPAVDVAPTMSTGSILQGAAHGAAPLPGSAAPAGSGGERLLSDEDLGISPHPGGVLSNAADESWLSGAAKGTGTAAVKAVGNSAGFVGGIGGFADYLLARAEHAITGKPVETILSELAQQKQTMQREAGLPAALDARNVLPTPADVSGPILKRTGEYIPETYPGKLAQAGAETALSMIGPGGGVARGGAGTVLRGATSAAPGAFAGGAVGQGVTDVTGDPLLGMGAGIIGGGAAHGTAAAGKKLLTPAVIGTSGIERVPVIGPAVEAARGRAAGQMLLDASSDPAALRQWSDAFGQAKANPLSVQPGGYSLRPEDPAVTATMPADPTRFRYDIVKDGAPVGWMNVSVNGDTATINNIRASGPIGDERGRLGTNAISQLMRDFAARHPEVTTIAGNRVSGARQAGRMVDDELGKPAQISVPQPTPVVEGSPRTLAGTIGKDRGLFQAEKDARNIDNGGFNAADRAQSEAQKTAIVGPYGSGDVFRPGQMIRERLNAIDAAHASAVGRLTAAHEEAVAGRKAADSQALDRMTLAFQDAHDRAAQAAQAAVAPLNALPPAEQLGAILRQAQDEATSAAAEIHKQLYKVVDPDGTLATVVTPLKEAKDRIAAAIDPHTGVQPSGAEAELWKTVDRLPDVIPFRSLQKLDSRVTAAMADARRNPNANDPEAIARLTQLKSAVMDAIDNGAENAAAHEDRLVNRGLLAPEQTIKHRVDDWLSGFHERQRQGRVAAGQGFPDAAGAGRSSAAPGVRRADGEAPEGRGGPVRDAGTPPPPRGRLDQSEVGGNLAYQAPDLGARSVSARMHAPETAARLGQDVPGTVVRAYGGPLDQRVPAGQPGIVAYHGSPHDFERFSSSGIGSGEGNQVYGHGLYFAENQGVAAGYRDALSRRDADLRLSNQGFRRGDLLGDVRDAFDHIRDAGGKIDVAIKEARDASSKKLREGDMEGADFWMKRANTLEHMKAQGFAMGGSGHLYQVKINRPSDHFLDWDKPLSGQSPFVREALQKLGTIPDKKTLSLGDEMFFAAPGGPATGADLYQHISNSEGGYNRFEGSRLSAKRLADAGIAGIRYLDADSRDTGQGSRNLVTFNDHDIVVTHKNGVELARPVALPQFLMGTARGDFVKELVGAGMNPDWFSKDLKVRADKLLKPGMHLDHGVAFENAFGDRYEAFRRALPGEGRGAAEVGGTVSGSEGRGAGDGLGRGGPGEAGGTPGQDLTPNVDPAAQDRLKAAKAAFKVFKERYENSTVSGAVKQDGHGRYAMLDSAIPAQWVRPGDKGYEVAKAFLAASDNDSRAVAAMKDASLALLRKNMPPVGNLHPNAVSRWQESYAGALRALDEVSPGFSRSFDNAADATQALLDLGAQHKQALADAQKQAAARALEHDSASKATMQAGLSQAKGMLDEAHSSPAGRFVGQGGDRIAPAEVENAVGAMLKTGKDGAARMRSLVGSVSSDPAALAGLRKAGVDWIVRSFLNSDDTMSGAAFIKFYRNNRDVLRELYGAAHTNMMGAVAADIERNARWRTTTAIKGGSDTAKNLKPMMEKAVDETKQHISIMSAAGAGFFAGGPKGAAGGAALYLLNSLRSTGIKSIQDLYREALLDPEKARYLISKMPPTPEGGKLRALTGALRKGLIVGEQLTSQPTVH